MSIGLIFWIIMILWLIFALAWNFNWAPAAVAHGPLGNSLLLFVLFLLLGWRVFGPPIHG